MKIKNNFFFWGGGGVMIQKIQFWGGEGGLQIIIFSIRYNSWSKFFIKVARSKPFIKCAKETLAHTGNDIQNN